jgi:hypothetical protein
MNLKFGTWDTRLKVAVTVVSAFSGNGPQVVVPDVHPPLNPANPLPLAVKVMGVFLSKTAVQLVAQLVMAVGLEETDPAPTTVTVSVGRLKLAVMLESAVTEKLQIPVVPLHALGLPGPLPLPLLQPVKFDTLFGLACSQRLVPAL